jgi:uridine kinase
MLIVSLSGGSGSGKTTLARNIVSKFPSGLINILPLDAYYKDHSHLSAKEKIHYNFDHPDSIDFDLLLDQLQQLKISFPIDRPVYSFITCSRENYSIKMEPSEILILEGLMTLSHEKLRKEANVKIYIDVSEINRLERIVARDVNERGRSRQMVENRFFRTVQPMHQTYIEPCKYNADIIIDGNDTNIETITSSIVQVIGQYLYQPNLHHTD